MPILPRKQVKTNHYHMKCTKCDYEEDIELESKDYDVIRNPELDPASFPRMVKQLPTICPDCKSKITSTQIPIHIRH